MAKVLKTISVEAEVSNDISERIKGGLFNFSQWIESEYVEQFMSENSKRSQILELKDKILALEKSIDLNSERQKALQSGMNEMEKRFLLDVSRMISEGMEWKRLLIRFNTTFHREYDLFKFKNTVKFLEDEKRGKSKTSRV